MAKERPNVIRLVPADSIRPSTYNPRQADPERLELVKLSLQKLGWLLPIYADAAGEILSGHQRHYVATEMLGMTELPVVYTAPFDLEQRKAINIAFNRGTNDMDPHTGTRTLAQLIQDSGVRELAESMPDATGTVPIMDAKDEPIAPLLTANKGRWSRHSRTVSRMLVTRGIEMPVIVDEHDQVVNGIGRLELYANQGRSKVRVLRVSGDTAKLAAKMLNLLTMDFDLHNRYQDELRYNSFRRIYTTRKVLGHGFLFAVVNPSRRAEFDLENPSHAAHWKRVHGESVLDFGAGHLFETGLLRGIGVRVTAFEPYRCGPDGRVNRDESMALTEKFLADVADGVKWDSLFISSVLNSVPFEADRYHLVTLLSALAYPDGTCYSVAMSTKNSNWQNVVATKTSMNAVNESRPAFKLDHEEGTVLGDFGETPKIQKYHTMPEFQELFGSGFAEMQTNHVGSNCQGIFKKPHPVDPEKLARAIEFEFDLPYPGGDRMGLVEPAKQAFEKRLGITLPR